MSHFKASVPAIAGLLAAALAGCGGSSSASPSDGGGTDSAPGAGMFQLAWQDDFDSFDSTRWALQTHRWDGNLAQFSTANTTVANGMATISLTPEPTDTAKPFAVSRCARWTRSPRQDREPDPIRQGIGRRLLAGADLHAVARRRLERARHRVPRPLHRPRADERDGVHRPPTTPPVTTRSRRRRTRSRDLRLRSVGGLPYLRDRMDADGSALRRRRRREADLEHDMIDRLKLPQNILLTIWASSAASWAGPIQSDPADHRGLRLDQGLRLDAQPP